MPLREGSHHARVNWFCVFFAHFISPPTVVDASFVGVNSQIDEREESKSSAVNKKGYFGNSGYLSCDLLIERIEELLAPCRILHVVRARALR